MAKGQNESQAAKAAQQATLSNNSALKYEDECDIELDEEKVFACLGGCDSSFHTIKSILIHVDYLKRETDHFSKLRVGQLLDECLYICNDGLELIKTI